MTNPSTRCGGRRPKSAKAQNRGKWDTGGAAGLWRFFGTFRKCQSQCVMSAYRGRPEVIGEGLKRRDLPNADFKSFVLSVMKRTSDRAVMAVTCAHYKSVSKPTLNQPLSGTTSMSSAPGATCSPSSRQQL